MAAYHSWQITLVTLAGVPLIGVVVMMANKALMQNSQGSSQGSERASSVAMEFISSIRTVAGLGHEPRAIEAYQSALSVACKGAVQMGVTKAALEGLTTPIIFVLFGLGLWFGAKLVADDMEDFMYCRYSMEGGVLQNPDANRCQSGGDIMTAFLCILFGFLALLQALPGLHAFAAAKGAAADVYSLIDMEPDATDPLASAGTTPLKPLEGRIELQDVHFSYPMRSDVPVYAGLNLTVEAGQSMALVGPSGCGKSTLVALLERFYDADQGKILLDGTGIQTFNVHWLRTQIGLVQQEPVLFEGTIGQNISLGREGATSSDVERAAGMAQADDFVRVFPDGYNTQVGEKGVQLSGGQKQRLAIARAIVRDPPILVLDEATSALDAASEAAVQAALDALLRAKKRTTVVIAHRLSTIRDCSQIAVLSGGIVVEQGTHQQLLEHDAGIYRSLVASQLAVGKDGNSSDGTLLSGKDQSNAAERTKEVDSRPTSALPEAATLGAATVSKQEVPKTQAKKGSVWWIWRLSMPEKWYFLLGLIGAVVGALNMPTVGLLLSEFILVFYNPDFEEMRRQAIKWALVFLGIGAGMSLAAIIKNVGLTLVSERLAMRLRDKAFQTILRQDIGWFDTSSDHTAGALANRLALDCLLIKALTGEKMSVLLAQIVLAAAALYVSFEASWILTLIIFGTVPLIVVPTLIQAKVVARFSQRNTESLVRAGRLVSETVLNIRTVSALGLQHHRVVEFSEGLVLPLQHAIRKGIATGIGTGLSGGVILIAAALQYFFGGLLFEKDLVEFGDLMRCVLVLIFMAFGMAAVSKDVSDKAEATEAARRVRELLDTVSKIDPLGTTGSVPDKPSTGHIEFRQVCFAYPARPEACVYSCLDLTIDAGSTVALVGPSGCGKSTLVALLERFYDVDEGTILFDKVDIRNLNLRWLRSQIGLVSQEPVLFSGTVAWNIGLGCDPPPSQAQIESAAQMANAHAFIKDFPDGYETPVGEKGGQLSGGQKQRIAIARALVRSPAVLVLDEATSALDAASEQVVQEALNELLRAKQCTTIIIAHRLSSVRNVDKITVFSSGKVVEEGPHDELVQKEDGVYLALLRHSVGTSKVEPASSVEETPWVGA
jgi:ATP-binding cassette subfamily B (MDR/TAP) protein 1